MALLPLAGFWILLAATGDWFPVCAAGNEVGFRHHYSGMISSETEYEDVEIRVSEEETGFTTELWASPPDLFTVGFVSPTGEVIQRIPFILGNETKCTFLWKILSLLSITASLLLKQKEN